MSDLISAHGRVLAHLDMYLTDHGLVRSIYNNFYPLGDGMYRCSQPSPTQIRRYHQKFGIRSIVNLRGEHGFGSYALEVELCQKLDLTLHDLRVYSRTAPTPAEVHATRELFDHLSYPALLHCKSGADRAGLASVLYRHFRMDEPIDLAVQQLGPRYGHFKWAQTGVLDAFFAQYLDFNARAPISFLDWLDRHYDPDALNSRYCPRRWSEWLLNRVLQRE